MKSLNSVQQTRQGSHSQVQERCFSDFKMVELWETSPLIFAHISQDNISLITYIFLYISMLWQQTNIEKNADIQNMTVFSCSFDFWVYISSKRSFHSEINRLSWKDLRWLEGETSCLRTKNKKEFINNYMVQF